MSLSELVQDTRDLLATIPDLGNVDPGYPSAVSNKVTVIVYPMPGDAAVAQHKGRTGKTVYVMTDTVVIERHVVIARDDGATGNTDSMPALDVMRDRLWELGTESRVIRAVRTDHYGFAKYGDKDTFVIRLMIDVDHRQESAR